MKRTLLALLAIITLLCFSSCNGYGSNSSDTSGRDTDDTVDTTIKTAETHKDIAIEDTDTSYTTEPKMKIRVSDGKSNVIFELNDSSAAKSLYEMLPIKTDVENYSNNEKIFYPTDPLDTSDVSEGDGPFGSLAYFSPWGNVVMYYSPCKKYTGLYLMGVATSGSNDIEQLSGTITITKED